MVTVSIIISAYNTDRYIERCIESCIKQTLKNIEIIIVDNHSTDKTLEIINNYQNYSNVKIIEKPTNDSLIESRNNGYKICSGEYVIFIDSDDYLDEDAINKLYNNAIKYNSDIVIYRYSTVNYSKTVNEVGGGNSSNCIKKDEYLKGNLLGFIIPSIWSKFIKKRFIENNKVEFPNNITYGEDLAFSISLAIHNPKVSFLNESLYYHYLRYNSTYNMPSDYLYDLIKATNFIKDLLIKNSLYSNLKDEFEYCAFMHNLYFKFDLIFKYNTKYSEALYNNWLSLKINITENPYYKTLFENTNEFSNIINKISLKPFKESVRIYNSNIMKLIASNFKK